LNILEDTMKKYLMIVGTLAAVAGCVGGLGRGCGGCISSVVQKEIEKQTSVDLGGKMSEEEIENYRLTDADVEKYIEDFPKLAKDFKELGETIEKTPGESLKGLALMTGSEKIKAGLRAMGWNPPEKFFAVHRAIWMTISYNNMRRATEDVSGHIEENKKEMEEMLNDPNIPAEQKRQIRESLKEMESSHEQLQKHMRELEKSGELEHNAMVVERHMDELNRMLEKLQ
jgi:hypothetical protein